MIVLTTIKKFLEGIIEGRRMRIERQVQEYIHTYRK